jgi:hypothetical protein
VIYFAQTPTGSVEFDNDGVATVCFPGGDSGVVNIWDEAADGG